MQDISLSLPTDATVCWHIMQCRLSDYYRVSEGFTASIIRVCFPQLFPAGSWSSVVRKTGTYVTKFLTTISTSDWCLCFIHGFKSYVLPSYQFAYTNCIMPSGVHFHICHNFIDCMHFTLLIVCTFTLLIVCTLPCCYCMHFTLLTVCTLPCCYCTHFTLLTVCTLPCCYCTHFTLLTVCTLPYWLYALYPAVTVCTLPYWLYALYPAFQKPFETVIIFVCSSFLGYKTNRNISGRWRQYVPPKRFSH
jgi:hypothetical protein